MEPSPPAPVRGRELDAKERWKASGCERGRMHRARTGAASWVKVGRRATAPASRCAVRDRRCSIAAEDRLDSGETCTTPCQQGQESDRQPAQDRPHRHGASHFLLRREKPRHPKMRPTRSLPVVGECSSRSTRVGPAARAPDCARIVSLWEARQRLGAFSEVADSNAERRTRQRKWKWTRAQDGSTHHHEETSEHGLTARRRQKKS